MNRKKILSPDEKRTLIFALEEATSRGLKIPEEAASVFKKKELIWPVDPRGYFVKYDGTLYNATNAQEGFIKNLARFSLFYSGRGGGKSAAGSQKALRKIMLGESGAVINPLFSDFKDSTWKEFKQWLPWNMVVPSQRHRVNDEWQPSQPFTMVFMNGATVMCKGLKNPNSARGPNINWLWYDESRNDITGMAWKVAIASVRSGKNPQAWTTTTPMGMSHWLYEFFIEKDLPLEVLKIMAQEGQSLDTLISSSGTTPYPSFSMLGYKSVKRDLLHFLSLPPYHMIFSGQRQISDLINIMESVHLVQPVLQSLDYFKKVVGGLK